MKASSFVKADIPHLAKIRRYSWEIEKLSDAEPAKTTDKKVPIKKKKKQIKSQNNYVLSNGIIRLKKASLSIASQIKDNDGIHHNTCG